MKRTLAICLKCKVYYAWLLPPKAYRREALTESFENQFRNVQCLTEITMDNPVREKVDKMDPKEILSLNEANI